jgi:excisionase family DNA binding protein
MQTTLNGHEVISPEKGESAVAKSIREQLASASGRSLEFHVRATGETLTLPLSAYRGLLQILAQLGQGNAFAVTGIQSELTTQQAADLLNVSRPYLVKLVDEGAIPSRKVGVQRRMLLGDVLKYREELYAKQVAGMTELAALSEELGLYDDEEPSR